MPFREFRVELVGEDAISKPLRFESEVSGPEDMVLGEVVDCGLGHQEAEFAGGGAGEAPVPCRGVKV